MNDYKLVTRRDGNYMLYSDGKPILFIHKWDFKKWEEQYGRGNGLGELIFKMQLEKVIK